jgi:GDP-mannose 6-dehydrogenase
MRVSVFGLGYVGLVSAACFAREGHHIIGVDISHFKVDTINSGKSPVGESGLAELIAGMVSQRKLQATVDAHQAVMDSDLSLICVGSPSRPDGQVDLTQVERVCEQIGAALRTKADGHTVVVRSTVLPGTLERKVVPWLERASGKTAARDFVVCSNPEFLREGTSLEDFYAPPFTLVGADHESDAAVLRELYRTINAPVLVVETKTAEMIKYACNSFHALKVAFANEIGSLCAAMKIDGRQVMEALSEDTKLNISAAYLSPGFAFGGSCLPKDLRAFLYRAQELGVTVPLMSAIDPSNQMQIDRAVERVLTSGKKRAGLLGLSFKPNTDDLRESPLVSLVVRLTEESLDVKVFDPDVSLTRLVGANRKYIEETIPHIASLTTETLAEVMEWCEVAIIGKACEEFRSITSQLREDQLVVDLAGLFNGDCPGAKESA